MGNSLRSRSIAEFEITKRYRCIRTTECNRATIFLSPPFLARKRRKRVRKDRFAISASASGSTKRSHLVDGVGRAPSSIAIAWLSRATRSKCFETTSSVSHRFYAYLIVNYVVESIPRFTGKISKWEVHLAGLGKDGLRMVNEIS